LSAHFIHVTATMPTAIITETIKIAKFCQKSKLPAKKARNNIIKESQQTPTITVPATFEPSVFIITEYLIK